MAQKQNIQTVKKSSYALLLFLLTLNMISCTMNTDKKNNSGTTSDTLALVTKTPFGITPEGTHINRYTLRNQHGLEVSVINYGGIITSLFVPDKNGVFEDVVLGFDSLADYQKENPFFGALIGRFGNRIAKGRFTLEGKTYTLATNNNENHLHGGIKGFDKVIWNIDEVASPEGAAIKLTYVSNDMEEGYPGTLTTEVTYTLTHANELKITYKATTDKRTIVNLTQHSYFNLSGNTKRDILGHELTLYANTFLPVDATLIPNGKFQEVTNTPFDFTQPTVVGSHIHAEDQQLKYGLGYDHCWVLNPTSDSLRLAAVLYDRPTGRQMEVFTTEPGIQFYSGNFLDGSLTGKYGVTYQHRTGLCLETQHFPDSPNQKNFPSVELNPGETYQSQTVYKFSVQ